MSGPDPIRVAELRTVADLEGVPDEELAWLADQAEAIEYEPGEEMLAPGQPVDDFWIVLRGLIEMTSTDPKLEMRSMVVRAGEITGRLPFSRMRVSPGRTVALEPVRVAELSGERVEDFARHAPHALAHLVHLMLARARRFTRVGAQREKLVGLGTMAAGLAHELNNPASAARRGARELPALLDRLDGATTHLVGTVVTTAEGERVAGDAATLDDVVSLLAGARDDTAPELDPLERADREDAFGAWLEAHEVPGAWDLAAPLVSAGYRRDGLEAFMERIPLEHRRPVLVWLASDAAMRMVGHELAEATDRISALVSAMKSYAYMDQSEEKGAVDVVKGIRDTITILGHKLRDRDVTLHDELPELPHVVGFGSELNQVWTNLLDNAVTAASMGGRTVRVRGRHHPDSSAVVVEICDDGPGIPPELTQRIFEPFFTTKGVGEGTGMGLDIANRIVSERHYGSLDVRSEPGDTRFSVQLPIGPRDTARNGPPS